MARKTIAERKASKVEQLRQLKEEIQELESRAAERLGRLAVRAGLADVELDDQALLRELETLAARFRQHAQESASVDQSPVAQG